MELNNKTENQIYCRKQDKDVSQESCNRCPQRLEDDYFDLFKRCSIEKDRFEALFRIYKKGRGEKK